MAAASASYLASFPCLMGIRIPSAGIAVAWGIVRIMAASCLLAFTFARFLTFALVSPLWGCQLLELVLAEQQTAASQCCQAWRRLCPMGL